jgi:hypothetical protein
MPTNEPTRRRSSPDATDLFTRRAPFRAASFDPETGAFSAVIATENPVARRDPVEGDYLEILSLKPSAVRLDRLNSGGAPLLDSHRANSLSDRTGNVTAARIESGELIADARLSPNATAIAADLAAGTPPAVSLGYRVYASSESHDAAGRLVITRTDWEPFEMSFVPIPADPTTHVRSQHKGTTMPNSNTNDTDIETRDGGTVMRASEMHEAYEITSRNALPMDFARQHITAGVTLEAYRALVLNKIAADANRISINSRSDNTFDNPDFLARSIEGALFARMTGARPEGAAAELMGRTMLDMGALLIQQRGEKPNWNSRDRLAGQILERSAGAGLSTSDFPNLLMSTGNRVLNQAYVVAQSPLLRLAKRRDAVDFRTLYQIKLSEAPRLSEVREGGEVTHGARAESVESFKLKTYAKIFSLTRQAIINDDLGAFSDSASAFGRGAAQTEADLLVSLLTANTGNGANLTDGSPLYGTGATRGNKSATGDAIGITSLGAGRQALRNMKDLDGKTPINATPKFLVVGPAKEVEAEQFLHTISAVDSTMVNPFGGQLTLAVDPRLTGNAWRLFADPAEVATIMVAYLNGADGPQVDQQLGWDVLGLEIRAVLDFGCGVNDFRGTWLNTGN